MNVGVAAFLGVALFLAGAPAAIACGNAKTGKVLTVNDPTFTVVKPGHYAYKPDGSGLFYKLKLGTTSRPKDLHFCVDVELPTPSGSDAEIGLYFWKNESNIYAFETREGRFSVKHGVFLDAHSIVFWSPIPIVGKEAARMREVELEAGARGASITIDGRLLTDFIARPPSGELEFGMLFLTRDRSTVLRFARPTVFGQ